MQLPSSAQGVTLILLEVPILEIRGRDFNTILNTGTADRG